MNKIAAIITYKAMLYVAKAEGLEIDEKFEELANDLLVEYDLDMEESVLDSLSILHDLIREEILGGNENEK